MDKLIWTMRADDTIGGQQAEIERLLAIIRRRFEAGDALRSDYWSLSRCRSYDAAVEACEREAQ